ncbi:hypothetical protein ACKWTF_009389 [Chironomus riparius]
MKSIKKSPPKKTKQIRNPIRPQKYITKTQNKILEMQLNGRENEIYEQYVATLCFSPSIFVCTMQRRWGEIVYDFTSTLGIFFTLLLLRRKYEVLKNISISIKLYALCFESFQSL